MTSHRQLTSRKRRSAVSGILAAVLLFGMMFTAGIGYFTYTSKNYLLQEQANGKAQNAALQASQERLNITLAQCMKAVSSCKYPGSLVLAVANTGGVSSTVVSVFATYQGANAFKPSSGYQYLTGVSGSGLNVSLPISIPVGSTTSAMKGCGGVSGSCNIDLILPWSTFTNSSKLSNSSPLLVSVLTQAGNTFTSPYPPFPLSKSVTIENLYQTTVTSIQDVITTVTNTQVTSTQFQIGCLDCIYAGGSGGSALLLQLQASPSPASTGDTISVIATVSNFAMDQATGVGVTLQQVSTGTASVSPASEACTSGGSQTVTIPGDTGGIAPSATFNCAFTAAAGATGGIVVFEGSAQGLIDTQTVKTTATSNPIQIGIVATLGPWAIKYFYFDYTSTKATSLRPVSTLAADGSSPDKYVAMYAIVTNTYSKPLTILDGSYLQLVSPSTDINFFIAQMPVQYSGTPSFSSYSCEDSEPSAPTGSTCITLAPGQSATLAFAADSPGSNHFEWDTSVPGWSGAAGETVQILLDYTYMGSSGYEIHAIDLPFQGVYIS